MRGGGGKHPPPPVGLGLNGKKFSIRLPDRKTTRKSTQG